MELGALVCGKSPQCLQCPLVSWCSAHKLGVEKERPVVEAKARTIPVTSAHGILIVEGKVLLLRRSPEGLWGNMWEFPGTEVSSGSPQEAVIRTLAEMGVPVEIIAPLGQVQHGYTNHRLTAHFFRIAADPPLTMNEISARLDDVPHRFVPWNKTEELAMPAHHRKMAERYFLRKTRAKGGTTAPCRKATMKHTVYWIEGDGIGPEIWKVTRPVLDAAHAVPATQRRSTALDWVELLAGEKATRLTGSPLPQETLDTPAKRRPSPPRARSARPSAAACAVSMWPCGRPLICTPASAPSAGSKASARPSSIPSTSTWSFSVKTPKTYMQASNIRPAPPKRKSSPHFLRAEFGAKIREAFRHRHQAHVRLLLQATRPPRHPVRSWTTTFPASPWCTRATS